MTVKRLIELLSQLEHPEREIEFYVADYDWAGYVKISAKIEECITSSSHMSDEEYIHSYALGEAND